MSSFRTFSPSAPINSRLASRSRQAERFEATLAEGDAASQRLGEGGDGAVRRATILAQRRHLEITHPARSHLGVVQCADVLTPQVY